MYKNELGEVIPSSFFPVFYIKVHEKFNKKEQLSIPFDTLYYNTPYTLQMSWHLPVPLYKKIPRQVYHP